MKRHDHRLITGLAILLVSLAAGGAEPPKVEAKPQKSSEQAAGKPAKAKPTSCDMVTGSMIRPRPEKNCESAQAAPRSFTTDDLQATGESDTVAALRKLDPSIR
jgi:hypothetical protein